MNIWILLSRGKMEKKTEPNQAARGDQSGKTRVRRRGKKTKPNHLHMVKSGRTSGGGEGEENQTKPREVRKDTLEEIGKR